MIKLKTNANNEVKSGIVSRTRSLRAQNKIWSKFAIKYTIKPSSISQNIKLDVQFVN